MLTDVLMAVNSHGLEFPSIHSTWLLDYKMKGVNSYVFKDKRILHELYESPISANDADIQAEAFDYIAANRESILGWWMSRNYGLRDVAGLDSCQSVSSIMANTDAISAVAASDFKDLFLGLESVSTSFATTAWLKVTSANNDIMSFLENSDAFKIAVAKNPDIQTATGSCVEVVSGGPGTIITQSNVFVVSAVAGYASWSGDFSQGYTGYVKGTEHGTDSVKTYRGVGESLNNKSAVSSKFMKSIELEPPRGTYRADISQTLNVLKYIQLDNVV